MPLCMLLHASGPVSISKQILLDSDENEIQTLQSKAKLRAGTAILLKLEVLADELEEAVYRVN